MAVGILPQYLWLYRDITRIAMGYIGIIQRDYPRIMQNHMEKKLENKNGTGII